MLAALWALAIANLIAFISGVTYAVLVDFFPAQEDAEESLSKRRRECNQMTGNM
jgi:hypothetical protein